MPFIKNRAKTGGRKRGVRNKIASLAAKKLADRELSAENTVELIRRGAMFDIGALFDEHGDFKPIHTLTEAQRAMIAGIEVVMKNAAAGDGKIDRVLKVKLVPKDRYVEMAARYHSLLHDKLDVNVTIDIGNRLERAREAARLRNTERQRALPSESAQAVIDVTPEKAKEPA